MTEVVEAYIYQLERPDGTVLSRWVQAADTIPYRPPLDQDGFAARPPWILRGRRSTEDTWVTLDERPDSIPRSADTDQAGDPPSSGV